MDTAIKQIDHIINKRGECVISSVMEQYLGFKADVLRNELKARGYVVRERGYASGIVVYPKKERLSQPRTIVQAI